MQYRYDVRTGVQKLKTKSTLIIQGVGLSLIGVTMAVAIPLGAHAASPSPNATDLSNNNWRVFNIDTSVPKLWDINKAAALSADGVSFPFQTSTGQPWNHTGWFSVYLKTNYSVNLTNKTITANVNVDANDGTKFWTRTSACPNNGVDAYVRLEFQSATGNYNASDYWWSTNSLALSDLATSGPSPLTASTDGDNWTNLNGQSGTTDAAGFAAALKNVKEIGVAFGSSCSYASGVNVSGGPASFELRSYKVEN